MLGGFAVLAFPAEYGNSGVISFMVNHEGVLYEKDLGQDTGRIAAKIDAFSPGAGWNKAEQ